MCGGKLDESVSKIWGTCHWQEEIGEKLTYEYADANPKLPALIGAVARSKRSRKS